jgi:hypothetical protein
MKGLTGAAVLVAVLLAASACGSSRHVVFLPQRATVGALAVPTPAGFHHSKLAEGGEHLWTPTDQRPPITVGGVLVSDYPVHGLTQLMGVSGIFPPNRVAFRVTKWTWGTGAVVPRLRFPLTLHQLTEGGASRWGGKVWAGVFLFRNRLYGVSVWLGGKAPAADRSAVVSALASVVPTAPAPMHESSQARLPASLVKLIRSLGKNRGVTGKQVVVYGPGSRRALVKASSGDLVVESAVERKARFYLIVLHGHFVGDAPFGAKPPRGTIETLVWSPTRGGTDVGISNGLPAAVSRLHKLAVISLH